MTAAFVTRQDLTDYLGRDVTADPGALTCVEAACDFCRTVAGQTFNRGTTTAVFDGTGTDALILPEFPANSIGTVAVADSAGSWTNAGSADYALNGDGILYATDTGGTSLFGTSWPKGRQNVRVTYDHGWTIGSTGDLPGDVFMVALTVAARLLVQGPAMFESLGDLNVRYAAESTALMPTERLILRKYRRAT